jgi:hypothetical protein
MKLKMFLISLLVAFVLAGCGAADTSSTENEAETESENTEVLQEETETEDNEIVIKKQTYDICDGEATVVLTLSLIDESETLKLSIFVESNLKSATLYGYMLGMGIYQTSLEHDEYDVEVSAAYAGDDEVLLLSNAFLYSSVTGSLDAESMTTMFTDSVAEENLDLEQFGDEFQEAFDDFLSE